MPIETIIANEDPTDSLAENGFYWREKEGVRMLVNRFLEEHGFSNGFSTRLGGVSPFPAGDLNLAGYDEDSAENIAENRRRFLSLFGRDYSLASCWQIHSAEVRHVPTLAEAADGNHRMDALVSGAEGVLVGVKTADCVPVLIGDPRTGAFAAVHAGWRGTVSSIVRNAVDRMIEHYGSKPDNLVAAIGPAATVRNYEIGQDVIDAFRSKFDAVEHLFEPTRPGHARIDLHTANKEQLASSGVSADRIFVAPYCTMERTDLFFSYRIEKKLHGRTGRLMSVIGRR